MDRVKLLLSYDGTDFSGWQIQAPGKATIQGAIEDALEKIFGQHVRLHGSGRTDAGAHAAGQVAHFDAPKDLNNYNLRKAIGRWLPSSIVICNAWIAPPDFHSLFSAERKTYKYLILNRSYPSALRGRYEWWVEPPLDFAFLQETSKILLGTHDFKSFQTTGTDVTNGTIRNIYEASWQRMDRHVYEFTITGSGFLKQMVRNIVGTLVDMNLKGDSPDELRRILAARDRRQARACAPAHGLYLYRVQYPVALDKKCRKL